MDANKDEAFKCLKIGKEAIKAGDRSRTLKFLEKARRLDPTLPIDGLVSHLMKQSDESVVSSSAKESSKRGFSSSSSTTSSSSFTEEEQRTIVREIKTKKNYYEILGLKKNNSSVEDIRKAYRKLWLKVHPDKNKAPGSEEAFKSVSKAFQCLSNEATRRKYDITGCSSDEPVYQQPCRATRRYNNNNNNGFNGFYDDEFDAPRRNYNYEFSDDEVLGIIDLLFWLYGVLCGFVSLLRRIKRLL